jgi:hypothetical protein
MEIPILASTAAKARMKMERAIKDDFFVVNSLENLKIKIFRRIISNEIRIERKNFFLYIILKRPKKKDRRGKRKNTFILKVLEVSKFC